MSAYTPGPWEVCPTNSGTFVKSKRFAGYLAEVRHCRTTQDVKADAHLIAAAPELLDALNLVVDTYDNGGWPSATIVIAKGAIAKATGERS